MPGTGQPAEQLAPGGETVAVRLLGNLVVHVGDRQLTPIESGRARALLGYLVLHAGASVPRRHLAFLLWPDSAEGQARTNLRKAIHQLRRDVPELDPLLEVTPLTLRWCRDGSQWVDVEELRLAVESAERPDAPVDQRLDALRRACEAYGGDLLPDCYDDWAVEARDRLRELHVSALSRLTGLLLEHDDPLGAVRFGQELLRADPLREDSYRLVMRAHAAAGDRAGAVRVFHQCVSSLDRELGVEPSPETADVYARLIGPAGPVYCSPATPRPGAAPLVGREAEWDVLTGLCGAVHAGVPHLAVVVGEPGIGKTRLVEEVIAWWRDRGGTAACAPCYPHEGELGYGALIAWPRAPDVAAAVAAASPGDRAVLGSLLPELGVAAGAGEAGTEAERRQRLFDAASRAVAALDRGIVLVADDAQWCDPSSIAFVHYLVRSEQAARVLVVATVRGEDLDDRHPLADVVTSLARVDRVTQVGLDRLGREETERLGHELGAGDGMDLYEETEGNPLFVVETVRAAAEGSAGGPAVAPKLQAVISARLRRCSNDALVALGAAATVGRAFDAGLVRAVSELDEATFVRALDELWRRGLVREHGADGYDFSHGRIRDVVYESLRPAARRRHHVLVAEALERGADRLDAVSGQVAIHYDRAGRAGDAVTWYRRAADEAQRRGASSDAVRLLTRAQELVRALPEDRRLAAELPVVCALPAALVGVDGFASDRVEVAQRRAVEVSGALGVAPDATVLRSLVMSRLCRHDFAGATAAAHDLRAVAGRSADAALLVEGEYLLGITAFWTGRLEAARAHFEDVVDRFGRFWPDQRAEHLVRFGHDPGLVCLSRLANTLWFLGRPDDARRARDDAVARAAAAQPYSRGAVHGFGGLLAVDLDDGDALRRHVAALGEEQSHARPTAVVTQVLAGYVDVLDGGAGAGVDRIRAAIEACGPADPAPGVHACCRRVLVAALAGSGQADVALAAADEALAASGSRLWEPELRRVRAGLLASTGADPEVVRAELDRAERAALTQGAAGPLGRIGATRSRLLAAR